MSNCKTCIYMYEDCDCGDREEYSEDELTPYCGVTDDKIEDVDAENDCTTYEEG